MEKVIAYQFNDNQMETVYKVCSQMRISVIPVDQAHNMMTLEQLMTMPIYRGNNNPQTLNAPFVKAGIGCAPALLPEDKNRETLLVMCELSQKHMDRLLATLRLTNTGIDYKAVLTPTNAKWNLNRVLVEMAMEKRAWELQEK